MGGRDFSDIDQWEVLQGLSDGTRLVGGFHDDLEFSGRDKFNDVLDLIVFDPTLGHLSNIAELGDAKTIKPGDILQQASITGARQSGKEPGLFEVTVSKTDYRTIRVVTDITRVGDSGLGLYDNNNKNKIWCGLGQL